jgi:hypothetical protein
MSHRRRSSHPEERLTIDSARTMRMRPHSRAEGAWVVMLVLSLCTSVAAQTQQEHVHGHAHAVMPFDVAKTVHVFTMTESGGIERVIVKHERDRGEVPLIRQHLRKEAMRFREGNYSDPATLHGAGMPGLRELQAGVKHVAVSYADVPDGGEITFTTKDLRLLTAIHRWFGAQLSEHGADARAG